MKYRPIDQQLVESIVGKTSGKMKQVREHNGLQLMMDCPVCGRFKCYMNIEPEKLGLWKCFAGSCGESGNFITYCQKTNQESTILAESHRPEILGLAAGRGTPRHIVAAAKSIQKPSGGRRIMVDEDDDVGTPNAPQAGSSAPNGKRKSFQFREGMDAECRAAFDSKDGQHARAYMQSRGFRGATLHHFNIGALFVRDQTGKIVEQYIAIPCYGVDKKLATMRFRPVPGPCLYCAGVGCDKCDQGKVPKAYCHCAGRPLPLFNADKLDGKSETPVIITEGEFDAMSWYEYGFTGNIVSGTGGAGTFKSEWVDILEPYSTFALCYDKDKAGEDGIEKLAKALGKERCVKVVVPDPHKDTNDCLMAGIFPDVMFACIEQAAPLATVAVSRVGAFKEEILKQMDSPTTSLYGRETGSEKLDEAIGGRRPGLTVVTGDTGCGKTTMTIWLAYKAALSGEAVLLTAFEQGVVGVIHKLLRMRMGGNFALFSKQDVEIALDELDKLPIYLLPNYGNWGVKDFWEVVKFSSRRMGITFVLLDHLGFIAPDDDLSAVNEAVRLFATGSVQLGIQLYMICHPNRMAVAQQRRVTMKDLKGSSAIEQDAHLVIVIEAGTPGKNKVPHPHSIIHIDKVRSEFGKRGAMITLAFDPESTCYADEWSQTPQGGTKQEPAATNMAKRRMAD